MKNILITGASGDIGSAIANALADSDSRLFLQGFHSADRLNDLCQNLAENKKCIAIPIICDVSNPVQVSKMFAQIYSYCDALDVLVNNAGISKIGLIQDMSIDDWHEILNTNLSSVFYSCRHAISGMVSKRSGKIINISSIWGNVGASCEVAYSATKGGINSFSRALAKELAPSNIQVNVAAFGVIDTKMNAFMSDTERTELISEIPADRMGRPDECGALVKFLSEAPEYLTGQIITLDGGLL